jgi:hypothetical protein
MMKPIRNIALIACAFLLSACGGGLNLKPVTAGDPAIIRNGYTVSPPQGKGWFIAEGEKKGVLFFKVESGLDPGGEENPDPDWDDVPHDFNLGVFPLEADQDSANASEAQFAAAAERYLLLYLTKYRRNRIEKYSTAPYRLKLAVCIRYEALNVGRYHPYRPAQQRLQFIDKGLLCRHPQYSNLLIHGYYTKSSFRQFARESSKQTEAESDAVLQSISFTQ